MINRFRTPVRVLFSHSSLDIRQGKMLADVEIYAAEFP